MLFISPSELLLEVAMVLILAPLILLGLNQTLGTWFLGGMLRGAWNLYYHGLWQRMFPAERPTRR